MKMTDDMKLTDINLYDEKECRQAVKILTEWLDKEFWWRG